MNKNSEKIMEKKKEEGQHAPIYERYEDIIRLKKEKN